jgi:membrane fusion protein, copper/silver efflux system
MLTNQAPLRTKTLWLPSLCIIAPLLCHLPAATAAAIESEKAAITEPVASTHQHQPDAAAEQTPVLAPSERANLLTAAAGKPQASGITTKYVCPMHAHIISDKPGTCPICGMNLEKVELGALDNSGGMTEEVNIRVSGRMQQALALKVATVERDTLWKFVETVGQVDYNESQISHIHARVSGWIEKLAVKSMGDTVKKGQLLYEIYSPELVNAQDDYLLALDTQKKSASPRYQDLVRRAGLRLSFLGFNENQINQLAQTKQTQYRIPFYASQDGVVETLSVRDGMYIEPQTEVMSLVDLSTVWVIADVFENEQNWIVKGQQAEIAVPAMDLSGLEGTIDYIYPELDPITRSLRVRLVINNSQAKLRPKTLAKVSIFGGPKKDVLVIPQQALIQTGKENRVIVKQADDSFAAKVVTVGMMRQDKVEIVDGLTEGERVVISGQFLLDSEASLKGSLMRLSSGHQH